MPRVPFRRPARRASDVLIRAIGVASLCCLAPISAHAQGARWRIDPRTSLAWWQVNPHLNHLWATTCPQDPSWRPGEGVSVAQARSYLTLVRKRRGYSAILDTIVPLYPRGAVRPVCAEAVQGEVAVDDTASWRGVRGWISVRADALETGLKMRDEYAHKAILQTTRFPEIRFRIDSLASVQRGDTLRAVALGVFQLHGVETPMSVPIKAWRDPAGLRVTGQFQIPARDLIERYQMSKWAVGLGVGTNIWKLVHMGADVILRPAGPQADR